MVSQDIVIIGAGAAGCACAYFLSQAGAKVTVIERDALASHASGFAYGTINPLGSQSIGIPGPAQPFATESMRLHARLARQLREETDIDTEFRPKPLLELAFTEEEARACQAEPGLAKGLPSLKFQWIGWDEARSLEPRISPKVLGALYVTGIAEVSAYRFSLALAQAADKRGASFRQGELVGLKKKGNKVTGVVLRSGEIPCETAVLAMGPWSVACSRWLGLPVPVEPLKGEILRLKAPGPPFALTIERASAYVTSKADGLAWAGTTKEKVGFNEQPTPDARAQIMHDVLEILPCLADSELVQQTACMRPLSADGLPILGPVPEWDGVYLATGAGGQGILLSPAFGQAIAEMITKGATSLPVGLFAPARFAGRKDLTQPSP